jgi:hypothetical protein
LEQKSLYGIILLPGSQPRGSSGWVLQHGYSKGPRAKARGYDAKRWDLERRTNRSSVGEVGVQTSDNGELALSGLTRKPQQLDSRLPRPPLADLSALWEMYSAVMTLAIVLPPEVCGAEEEVGRMGNTCSGIQRHPEKYLLIVEHHLGG